MDAVYVFRHSVHDDLEIRYSLRSVARYAPYIRKVWIFGDRPLFLNSDPRIIEHVPEGYLSRAIGLKPPVVNMFLMMFLSSLIPNLAFEYLFFADDFFLLKDYPIEEARKDRYFQDLAKAKSRGRSLWKDSLWRTYDLLTRFGYAGLNFETHCPTYLTRRRVFEAYCEFRDFVSEDRFYGLVGPSAILNHAMKREGFKPISIVEENSRAGFWGKPPEFEEIQPVVEGKTFFNFDDDAFGDSIKRFLSGKFPEPCKYEQT